MNYAKTRKATPQGQRQQGVVLVISLLMLLLMTLIGVSSMRGALMEERITGNVQDHNVALQAAEGALRDAERFLRQPFLPPFNGNGGLYPDVDPALKPPRWINFAWDAPGTTRAYGGMAGAPGSLAKASASYFIEELSPTVGPGKELSADTPEDSGRYYRITARGVGISGTAVVILQSTYHR